MLIYYFRKSVSKFIWLMANRVLLLFLLGFFLQRYLTELITKVFAYLIQRNINKYYYFINLPCLITLGQNHPHYTFLR